MIPQPHERPRSILKLPAVPVVCVSAAKAVLLTEEGEVKVSNHSEARNLLNDKTALVCHAPYTAQRLEMGALPAFDVLELFAFVHPGAFCVPTPSGLSKVLGLSVPKSFEDYPESLIACVRALLTDLQRDEYARKADPLGIAAVMGLQGKGWAWTPFIFSALGQTYNPAVPPTREVMNIWKHLPAWAEDQQESPPAHYPVTGEESRRRLAELLGNKAEERVQQMGYATALTAAFAPAQEPEHPHAVLAEAGTGIGKTLGYLAPASVWAEKNDGSVWISTYTKNLQRQIEQELDRLYPDPDVKAVKAAIRKGRENYLCLLNLEEAAAAAPLARTARPAVAAGIMARWAAVTKDGDLTSGDFPGWLTGILGLSQTLGLADRRGECLYAACDHYHRCFVERAIRKSRRADIVVANHALVMIQTADSGPDSQLPQRYVFDEGHHLFDAADSAYAGHLTAQETYELRRWLLGSEGGRKSRARGLRRRTEDLVAGDEVAQMAVAEIQARAKSLTGEGWQKRLKEGTSQGTCEHFLWGVHTQVMARGTGRESPYSIETGTRPLNDDLLSKARMLKNSLKDLHEPITRLSARLKKRLTDDGEDLDTDLRKRIDAVTITLGLRASMLSAWIAMLETLEANATPPEFVDWMEITRIEGQTSDVGLYRHWLDPMRPFAASIKPHAHGIVVTSATLRDGTSDEAENSRVARERTGMNYLSDQPYECRFESPFDYSSLTKVLVVTDVRKDDTDQVASAYRAMFEAAGGGGLGLFTAIQRLRAVHRRIAAPLEKHGISLYAQHADQIDPGTLVDIFRDDINACLLGTDAMRDGVDVPGESLRLIVFDRVPWARPTILHKARREAFGKKAYDDRLARLKLKQAYGRLVRRATDRGVFVMLDPMLPSRLYGAFPPGVAPVRTGIKEAVHEIKNFLQQAI